MGRTGWTATGLLAVGVILGASLFGGSAPSVPPTAPAAPDVEASPPVDPERIDRRRRAALTRLLDRTVGPQRAVVVDVRGCARAPGVGADVALLTDAGATAATGRTDADGRVVLRASADAVVTAVVTLDGATASSLPSADGRLAVTACPGATVEGRVVDSRGRPVADATVALGDDLDVAVTDARGEFVLTDVELLADRVTASSGAGRGASELAPLAPYEVRAVELVVDTVRRLTGHVVDVGGAPVGYAEITAWSAQGAAVASARSDRLGRFWLDGVPLDDVTLVAADRDGGLGELRVAADAPTDGLVVSLEPAGRLTVDYVGTFRGRFDVAVADRARAWPTDGGAAVASLAAGEVVTLAAPRAYRVTYEVDGERRLCGQVLLAPGASAIVGCGDARPTEIVGRVVDATGAPLADVEVMVAGAGIGRVYAATGSSGAFSVAFDAQRSTPAMVIVADRARGFLPTRRRNVPVTPGAVTDVGVLRLDHADAFPELGGPGPFGGIGARVEDAPDGILLSAIVAGGPLDRAGVRGGDVVTAIGDQTSGFLPALDAVRLLRGAPGTSLTLRLRDTTGATRDVTIERSVIDVDAAGWVN